MCFCCWLHQHRHFARWFHVWLILTQVSSSQGPSDSGFPAHFSCHLHTSPPSFIFSCFSHDWTISWIFYSTHITRKIRIDFDDFVWNEAKFWSNHLNLHEQAGPRHTFRSWPYLLRVCHTYNRHRYQTYKWVLFKEIEFVRCTYFFLFYIFYFLLFVFNLKMSSIRW